MRNQTATHLWSKQISTPWRRQPLVGDADRVVAVGRRESAGRRVLPRNLHADRLHGSHRAQNRTIFKLDDRPAEGLELLQRHRPGMSSSGLACNHEASHPPESKLLSTGCTWRSARRSSRRWILTRTSCLPAMPARRRSMQWYVSQARMRIDAHPPRDLHFTGTPVPPMPRTRSAFAIHSRASASGCCACPGLLRQLPRRAGGAHHDSSTV